MSDDPFFDAMPASTPDEYGSWDKGKSQDIRDAFPTPEAYKAAVDAAVQRLPPPRHFEMRMTADGLAFIDRETGNVMDTTPEDR